MICQAILRKSPKAGSQCPNQATRGAFCVVHDPAVVLPRLRAKRARIEASLRAVDSAIANAERSQEPECNPS